MPDVAHEEVKPFPWHFIALDYLGIPIPDEWDRFG